MNQEQKPRYDVPGESTMIKIGRALLPGLFFGIAMLILIYWVRASIFQDQPPNLD